MICSRFVRITVYDERQALEHLYGALVAVGLFEGADIVRSWQYDTLEVLETGEDGERLIHRKLVSISSGDRMDVEVVDTSDVEVL